MRLRLGLAALVAVAGSLALGTAPPSACMGTPCDEVNLVCRRALGAECLG